MNNIKKIFVAGLVCCGFAAAPTTLASCSDDDFAGDAQKNWAGTTETFSAVNDDTDDAFSTDYKHALGRIGDPMPFYDKKAGDFKVLYLQDYNNNSEFYHPIWAVSTKDGCHYESLGEIIAAGTNANQQDAAIGTGCAVYNEKEGLYYIYYTGENARCESRQVVMRATSSDFKTWTKDREWRLNGPDYGFSGQDFRDPQIFEDGGVYYMVIVSKNRFAYFKSSNLKDWTCEGGFNMVWDRMCECPDVFKMGNWWYLVYSEAYPTSWSRKVKYMMADSFEGLRRCFDDPGANWPKDDKEGVLDSRAFYAGKTASDGQNRYIWGWCPYRTGTTFHDKNIAVGANGEPNWSGALVCHRLVQHENGTLTIGEVPAMAAKYNTPAEAKVMDSKGYNNGNLTGDDAYVLFSRLGNHNHISFTVKTAGEGDKFGISFCRGTDAKKYYTMVVNPEWANGRRKVNFEQEGPEGMGFVEGIDGYIFPRPADNTYNVSIYTDNSVVTMYINGVYGYTQRIYGIYKNCWSINNYGGSISVSNVQVSNY